MTVSIYDHIDRVIYTSEWNHGLEESALREGLLSDETVAGYAFKFPTVDDLTPGTDTHTIYNSAPNWLVEGVELYPDGESLEYTRGRVAAEISDESVEKDDDGSDKVIRVSTANSYDKYGRVVKTFSYDPTIYTDADNSDADSLKLLAVETEYNLGGKVISTTKYPFGLTDGGKYRRVVEYYTYDPLGRISRINVKNGASSVAEMARYYYFPTGAVRGFILGNSISMYYLWGTPSASRPGIFES